MGNRAEKIKKKQKDIKIKIVSARTTYEQSVEQERLAKQNADNSGCAFLSSLSYPPGNGNNRNMNHPTNNNNQGATVGTPLLWKERAFTEELKVFYGTDYLGSSRYKNVISFGDSPHEREAIIKVTDGINNCRTKSLKFMERPDLQQLSKEHMLIQKCLDQIVLHESDL